MVEESDRLIRLINDLFLIARVDAGRSIVKEPLEIHLVVEDTARQVKLPDPNRQINLDVPTNLEIIYDRDALKQLLVIMLDNVIKHAEGDIDVQVDLVDSWVEFRMRDYGEGIAPDVLPNVFDRFYRDEDQVIVPGFGLGLSITKALFEGVGGKISIESELDKGSETISQFKVSGDR